MKPLFTFLMLCLIYCPASFADFDLPGKGELIYPTGMVKPFEFGFGWNEAQSKIRIGNKQYDLNELPESYSVAIAMSKDEKNVWVQEFAKGYFEQFNWQIGSHVISLRKQSFDHAVKGDYVLTVDGTDYFFVSRAASITIKFAQDGIESVTADGVTKDMGNK
ncbi:hypothetical protein [Pseudoalteromonas ulvae]|uniref:Secreted protein n=1 Tax=Pseudoalteromonas ulvae TaxID=107327 RepID=A0A244CUT6_PSEDV|nr:hypothetical protein [Pseudoalteromonas ulvae]OUL59392.1 hypothetical protein B1199_03735 [Pseudoalteromonas ulvae]